jgi:hypothetical protein
MDNDMRQRALRLQAEVLMNVAALETTNDCWKKCKDKTMGTALTKNEKECFHHCTIANFQSEQLLTRRTEQHVEQQARAAREH